MLRSLRQPARKMSGLRLSRVGVCAALALTLSTPGILGQASGDVAGARTAMQAGLAAAGAGDLNEAKRQFAKAVRLTPSVPEGHAALGNVLLYLGEREPALEELSRAHALAPHDAAIDISLGVAQAGSNHPADAVKSFRSARAEPNCPAFAPPESAAFATALASTGEAGEAEELLRAALAQTPDSSELEDASGSLLARKGAMNEALPFFKRAVSLAPDAYSPNYHLGVALLALNQPADALQPLRRAVAAQPQNFDANLQLGRALQAAHEEVEGLEVLHRTAALKPDATSPQAYYQLALGLQAGGDAAGSLPWFDRYLRAVAPTSEELTNNALARVQTGDAKGAIPLYARALALGPDLPILREDYGVAYLQQADLDHAMEQFKAGLALDPSAATLHYDLGIALKLKDNLPAAIPEFEKAAELDPTLPDPAYTLGVIYMQQGRFAEAAAKLKLATALQPNNGDAWALLGSVLKDSNDPAGATDALKKAIELEPDQPSLHIQLAALEVQGGDKAAAAADRKIAADLSRAATNRQRASFALKSGRSLLADGKVEDAVVQLLVAVDAVPTLAEPHRLLAEAYARQGKAADAALERRTAAQLTANPPKMP